MRTGSRRNGDPTTSPRSASLDDTYLSSPFLLCFHLVQGSGFKVQVAASPPFFRRWYSRIAAFPSRVMLLS